MWMSTEEKITRLMKGVSVYLKSKGRVSYPTLLLDFKQMKINTDYLEEAIHGGLQKLVFYEPVAGQIELFK